MRPSNQQIRQSKFATKVEPLGGRQRLLIGYKLSGNTVDSQSDFTIVDRDEEGDLVGFEMEVNSSQFALELTLQGDNHSTWQICNDTMQDLLRKGRGITPGDAETTSGQRSKDPTGQRSYNFVFLARYKDEEFTDYLGTQDRVIVARFDPPSPIPYTGITCRIKNYNALETEPKTIVSGQLLTYVYGDFPTHQGMELHTDEIIQPDEELTDNPQGIDEADTPVHEPPPEDEGESSATADQEDVEDEISTANYAEVVDGDINYSPAKPSFMAKNYEEESADT